MASVEVITLSSSPLTSPVRKSRQSPRSYKARQKRSEPIDEDFFLSFDNVVRDDAQGSTSVTLNNRPGTKIKSTYSSSFQASVAVRLNSSPSIPTKDSAIFDDSLFDDHDFTQEQPAKKRKLSPKAKQLHEPSLASKALASVDVFDLSSESNLDQEGTNREEVPGFDSDQISIHDPAGSDDDLPDMADLFARDRRSRVQISGLTSKLKPVEILSDEADSSEDPILTSSQFPHKHKSRLETCTSVASKIVTDKRTHKKSTSRASDASTGLTSYAKISKSTKTSRAAKEVEDKIIDSSQPGPARSPAKKPKRTSGDKESEIERKRAEKERKAAEKEAEKEQKRLEKERKAIEKQRQADIAEVNKRKTDKKQTVEEMIIDLPKDLKGKSLGNKVEEEIKSLGAGFTYYADELDMTDETSEAKTLGNIIKWRRKTNSTYNQDTEEWVPLPSSKTVAEKHILVHLTGENFASIAASCTASTTPSTDVPTEDEMKHNLDMYMTLLRSKFPCYTIVLLLDGLQTWLKKHVTAKNREYTAAVRAQPNPYEQPGATAPSARTSRKRKQTKPDLSFFTAELAEDLLLHLQLTHQPLHVHHAITSHAYREVIAFTQQLSTRPYRAAELERNLANASFCMASGQFRSGQGDPKETWRLMLEQVNRLTVSMAKGIINEGHDSPAALIEAFEKIESGGAGGGRSLTGDSASEREARERAKVMLQDVKRSINKVGDCGDKRLGPQISKRLYKVFMTRDPGMRDGIA